ncbi:Predicted membrane protein [Dermatophilus congolensis]|uniref:Predicted membrane protein n=2 Tax=Dermatophilus congolensis TaxID=1863 RepID=A0AA46BMK1_9MICO|nr:Predicted membrane protein [Dermatophilus congolensis]
MRTVATALLIIAAIVYALTFGHDGPWGYVNATAEAAMIGALADWFAVTAIFRHPLGLPIPHTALIPRKKDTVATSLEDFFLGYFLTPDAVRQRVQTMNIAQRTGRWLTEDDHAERVVHRLAPIASRALNSVDDNEIRGFINHTLVPKLTHEPISPLAGALLDEIVTDRIHTGLVDLLLDEALAWLLDNPEQFSTLIADRAPTWTPHWLNGIVTDRVHTECIKWIQEVRSTPHHRVRQAIDDLLTDLARDLQNDPTVMERTEALKTRLLTHPQTTETAIHLWEALVNVGQRALTDTDSHLINRATDELRAFGQRLLTDPHLAQTVTNRLAASAEALIATFGRDIATVISQVIRSWDGKEAAERIELHVGKDLQYIRINGTIVGGLAGLLIHTISHLLL